MKRINKPFLYAALLAVIALIVSAAIYFKSAKKKTGTKHKEVSLSEGDTTNYVARLGRLNPQKILKIDLKQDLTGKSLQDLRLLKSAMMARQGYVVMEAELRHYFEDKINNYDSLMLNRIMADEQNGKEIPLKYSAEEQAFMDKLQSLIDAKLKENYVEKNGQKLANVGNIINLFQFKKLPDGFMDRLAKNNFVIIPNQNIQFFHAYEQNDYQDVPSFITTDIYLQLFHMYFSYTLKALEQDKFMKLATELSEGMVGTAGQMAYAAKDPKVKAMAEYNQVFYSIPAYYLTGKKNSSLSGKNLALLNEEIQHIESEQDGESNLLNVHGAYFPYSLFKPRGHYTRNDKLKKYFKAMMWLQMAPRCLNDQNQLMQASLAALMLNTGDSPSGAPLMDNYKALYEAIAFLIGEPDNLSVMDIAAIEKDNHISSSDELLSVSFQQKLGTEMQALAKTRNRIKPKVQLSCPDKINFMPQRYLADNEVLQAMVDIKQNAERAYPRGLDVFAAFGNQAADDILLNELKDQDKWKDFVTEKDKLKSKFSGYNDWNKAVYNKWMESLMALQQRDEKYPSFMQSKAWDKKNLNTSLASWTELKHDAILYGEQPEAAECGDGGDIPPPVVAGYVEPNVRFWEKAVELLELTENLLKDHKLMNEGMISNTNSMKEKTAFLLSASKKELNGEKLTDEEFSTIEVFGSSVEYMTLSLVEPDYALQNWDDVKGPDHDVSVVADVYTRNLADDNKNGILHEGVGKVNDIYVVVEIGGYLYLTKGAVFSYYEFVRPPGDRLNDEQWQKMLEKGDLPKIPQWMEEIILPTKERPVPDEKEFYSSGC